MSRLYHPCACLVCPDPLTIQPKIASSQVRDPSRIRLPVVSSFASSTPHRRSILPLLSTAGSATAFRDGRLCSRISTSSPRRSDVTWGMMKKSARSVFSPGNDKVIGARLLVSNWGQFQLVSLFDWLIYEATRAVVPSFHWWNSTVIQCLLRHANDFLSVMVEQRYPASSK